MATLSSASLIQSGDKIVKTKVVLDVYVNVSAYRREYGDGSKDPYFTINGIKEDVREAVLGAVENADMFPEGILTDAELES